MCKQQREMLRWAGWGKVPSERSGNKAGAGFRGVELLPHGAAGWEGPRAYPATLQGPAEAACVESLRDSVGI